MHKLIQVFEYQTLKINRDENFDEPDLLALQKHYGEEGVSYYSLVHNGVRFKQFVGVIQIGNLMIEVLPKIDKLVKSNDDELKNYWQTKLIDMLLVVNGLDAKISSQANLNLKSNAILDVYFKLFIDQVETLLHKGLIKQYHKQKGNMPALKGRLNFSQHIQQNSIHKERFYVEYSVYDNQNIYNQILYKTLHLINQLNTNSLLKTRLNLLLLNFPEMKAIHIDNNTFERINYGRKNEYYQVALSIAELLLLNYHSDVTQGKRNVLALMFDMNKLWEQFVLASLRRFNKNPLITIKAQQSKHFWKSSDHTISVKPDIVIHNLDSNHHFVLDTKWKCPTDNKPSVEDLRQLYTYHHYYHANKVALVYPSATELGGVLVDMLKLMMNLTSYVAHYLYFCQKEITQLGNGKSKLVSKFLAGVIGTKVNKLITIIKII